MAAGTAIIVLSKRSSTPPCPGRIVPESLIPNWRFIKDSVKSPQVPKITTTIAIPTHTIVGRIGKKCAKAKDAAMQNVAPPIEPLEICA